MESRRAGGGSGGEKLGEMKKQTRQTQESAAVNESGCGPGLCPNHDASLSGGR